MDHLFDRSAKFGKRILLVWVFAIMWLHIGNIINFHQHHIWGKQLLPVAIVNSRSKEKSVIQYQDISGHLSFDGNHTPVINEAGFLSDMRANTTFSKIITHPPFIISVTSCLNCRSLRAPPVA